MFAISSTKIDAAQLKTDMADVVSGAFVAFEGWVRNHNEGRAVLRLEYEAYEPLAAKEAAIILTEAAQKFDIVAAWAVHRVGCLEIGDMAVWVGVTARHRQAAFSACAYIIDEIKSRVPIWKKEHYADGDSGWINCEATK